MNNKITSVLGLAFTVYATQSFADVHGNNMSAERRLWCLGEIQSQYEELGIPVPEVATRFFRGYPFRVETYRQYTHCLASGTKPNILSIPGILKYPKGTPV